MDAQGGERGRAATWFEEDGRGTEEQVTRPDELWRIQSTLAAVRAELGQLGSLEDAELRTRLGALERRWRAEIEQLVPASVGGELEELAGWAGEGNASPSELRVGLAQLQGWLEGFMSAMGIVVAPPASESQDR
jgi:hypothetical protein